MSGPTVRTPSTAVSSPAGLLDAIAAGVPDIEIRGTLRALPMITLGPGVSLRGGTLEFRGRGIRLTSDNTLADLVVRCPDVEVAVCNDTSVENIGRVALQRIRARGQVFLQAADAVRGGHIVIDQLHVEAADTRGRYDRPHSYGVDALQGAVTIWNRQPTREVTLTAEVTGVSMGASDSPIRGSGVFIAGSGEGRGRTLVTRLHTGSIFTDGGIEDGMSDLISGGVFVVSGAEVEVVSTEGPVTTLGPNDMVLDNWGRVGQWLVTAAAVSHGPSAIGFVNFGTLDQLEFRAPIETFGVGARGFNLYDGHLSTASFSSITTHADGAPAIQLSKRLPTLELSGDLTTEGGRGTSLVKGRQQMIAADALSVLPTGSIGQLRVGGQIVTRGDGVTSLDLQGPVGHITVSGGVVAEGVGSDAAHVLLVNSAATAALELRATGGRRLLVLDRAEAPDESG